MITIYNRYPKFKLVELTKKFINTKKSISYYEIYFQSAGLFPEDWRVYEGFNFPTIENSFIEDVEKRSSNFGYFIKYSYISLSSVSFEFSENNKENLKKVIEILNKNYRKYKNSQLYADFMFIYVKGLDAIYLVNRMDKIRSDYGISLFYGIQVTPENYQEIDNYVNNCLVDKLIRKDV